MSTSNCTYDIIFATELGQRCQFVLDNCEYEYINYYSIHFCLFNSNYFLTIPTALVFLSIFFLVISSVSNSFLSPALTKIVDTLKISQNLAGVTLIAIGNGAGDVISSIVASNGGDGIELALGGLLGSGMLLTSFILGIIVYYGKEIKVNKPMFNRDIFLFIVALLVLIAFSINKRIILLESIGFIGLYLLNVAIAFFQDWQNRKRIGLEAIEKKEFSGMDLFPLVGGKPIKLEGEKLIIDNKSSNDNGNTTTLSTTTSITTSSTIHSNGIDAMLLEPKDKDKKDKERKFIQEENMDTVLSEIYNYEQNKNCCHSANENYQMIKNYIRQHYSIYNDKEWEEINCFSQFIYITIKCPINIITSMTIPSCEDKHWKKTRYIIMPILIFFFFIIAFKAYKSNEDNLVFLLIGMSIALLSFFLCFCFLPAEFPENKAILLSILSLVLSLIWIWFIANNLISLLQMIGMLFNLPDAFLGITILALGNSVCDLSLNITLVKGGYGEMAVTSSLAGPLLNLLIGLGISLVKTNLMYGDIPFNVYTKETIITAVAVVFLLINLVRLAFQGRLLKYNLTRDISYVGFGLYLIFVIVVCIITFI